MRDSVKQLGLRSTILDGEIVALDEEGIPRFQLLQKWQRRPTAPVAYVCLICFGTTAAAVESAQDPGESSVGRAKGCLRSGACRVD